MPITASATLKTLETLIKELETAEGAGLTRKCMTIAHILDELEKWAENSQTARDLHPASSNASLFIIEMRNPLFSIAGLNSDQTDKIQGMVLLLAGIRKLKGPNCFAVDV